jgi:hypothetical protein
MPNEQVKIASLSKYCAGSFAMPMKMNNVSTIRACHCILRQQISSERNNNIKIKTNVQSENEINLV